MVAIKLPDGSVLEMESGVNGFDIANKISAGLAKAALAITVNGKTQDLSTPITTDATVTIITGKDKEGLHILRHSCSHVMAQAVKELWPDVQVTIGPAIENGFYYDFARKEPFTTEDFEKIEAKMHEIVAPFMDEMVKKHKCIGEARCIGLFGALEVVKNKETREPMQEYGVPGPVMPWIFAELKKRGFATFGRENFIEICPPLIITEEELKEYLPILDEVLTMVDEKYCD